MATKKRGGKRRGSGRKPLLSWGERVTLGSHIDWLLRQKTWADFDRSMAQREAALRQLWNEINQSPVKNRRKWRERWQKEHGLKPYDPELDSSFLGQKVSDVRLEIEDIGGPIGTLPIKTKKGIRPQVLRSVARDASLLWKVHISERMAEKCLEAFRAFRARAKADDELAGYTPEIGSGAGEV